MECLARQILSQTKLLLELVCPALGVPTPPDLERQLRVTFAQFSQSSRATQVREGVEREGREREREER
ncbi:hypothetical protein FJT64_022596 [Amphibalanus amphitrite]|uniref:Uncharacterized protein n=1 Tax=Amphibalanus amphitrite TaxID=1232801 RepID=A0A6A4WDU2_AMPAM|nr:hypothetical protein FJT64_022596 [Amphibalanus amphitrite]